MQDPKPDKLACVRSEMCQNEQFNHYILEYCLLLYSITSATDS